MQTIREVPDFLLYRNARATGSEGELRRLHTSGALRRLRSGVFIENEPGIKPGSDDAYRFQVHAAAQVLRTPPQFSHDSAAVLWALPTLGRWSRDVHVLSPRASGGRSHSSIRRHCVGEEGIETEIEGLRVTSLARTLVDVSCTSRFVRAVGMLDHALRQPQKGEFREQLGVSALTKAELVDLVASLVPYSGSAKALKAIDFADGEAGSLLESLSRVQFMLLGIPAPQLQVPFYDDEGFIGNADFYWPELGLIGESDGDFKYDGTKSPSGLSAEEVKKAEKAREDRMRRLVKGFVRWDWGIAYDRMRLAAWVRPFGLVPEAR